MNRFNLVALYVRVSTDKQVTEGYSLEAQETVLRDKAISDGKVVYKVYSAALWVIFVKYTFIAKNIAANNLAWLCFLPATQHAILSYGVSLVLCKAPNDA